MHGRDHFDTIQTTIVPRMAGIILILFPQMISGLIGTTAIGGDEQVALVGIEEFVQAIIARLATN
jgi:hypothetical protein